MRNQYVVAYMEPPKCPTMHKLNIAAGGKLNVGRHVAVHVDRLGRLYIAGLRRWGTFGICKV